MSERLIDYGIVIFIVVLLSLLFRLSRYLLNSFISRSERKGFIFSSDMALLWGMRFLLVGMLLLPFITSMFAFINNKNLIGGMPFHLFLTAISVVLFSFSEDLFRDYNSYNKTSLKPQVWHAKQLVIPVVVFWLIGILFISPLFYSGLTILIVVFYKLCLVFRKTELTETTPNKTSKKNKKKNNNKK